MATIKITGLTKSQADAIYDAAEDGIFQDKMNDILSEADVEELELDVLDERVDENNDIEYIISVGLLDDEDGIDDNI